MDYEKIIKQMVADGQISQEVAEKYFPELKKNENERIRTFLHHTFTAQYLCKDKLGKWHGEPVVNILAWLKKQGKPNPYSGVSFEYNGNTWGMCARDNGVDIIFNRELIQHVSVEKQGEKKPTKQPNCYELEEEIEEWLGCEAFPEGTNITPLPKAMEIVRETANHFYDFGRKQQAIRNIQCTNSQVITPESYINEGQKKGIQRVLDNPQEYGLQKSADKKELKKVIAPIFHIGDRVRYKGHACDGVITEITDTDYICGDAKLPISTQDKLELVEQKSAWSEEDEENIDTISKALVRYISYDGITQGEERRLNHWLKALKERYAWKPSDEQMLAINTAINELRKESINGKYLIELMEQLKKLKG